MCRNRPFFRISPTVATLLLAASFCSVHAVAPSSVVLPESTKPVAAEPATGTTGEQRPFVSRPNLTAAESNAPMTFEVALKLPNFPELQARISRGERISAQEMVAKYEPSAANYQAVVDWLKGDGFTIVRTDSHHMAIFARGTVREVATAFKVTFARVAADGKEYSSAVTAPSVPATISKLLVGINGLQPHLRARKHLIKQEVQPNASTGSGSYLPSQIAQAYAATGLYNSNITGAGQTIAIVIDTFPTASDLELFWSKCNVNQSISNISFIQAVTGTLPAPSGEESLDVEWSSAIAPGAKIRVYASTDLASADLDQTYQQVYEDVMNHPEYGIHEMSMSFGEGETYTTYSQVETDDQYFAELSSAGVTCFASAGDGGATPGPNGGGDESGPLQVETPASDPNVTAVGGTSLVLDSNNNVTSEVVWNDSSGASSGGTSIYFSRPGWQVGTGVPAGTQRLVPDVACSADPDHGAITYLNGSESTVGGTSWACPTWTGLCALINQVRGNAGLTPMGMLGPNLYALLSSANYPANIRDITSGNNATRRSSSTNGIPNYTAGTDYDLCTGIGVPLAQALSQTLEGEASVVREPPAFESILPAESAKFAVVVSGNSATYQWQELTLGGTTWSNLSDNGTFSGSFTASLTVSNATTAMSGDEFQCVINLGGNVVTTTTPSSLIVDTPLVISTLAGLAGTTGLQNGSGTGAEFAYPSGIAVDSSGDLFIADYNNNAIREVTSGGTVSTPYGIVTNTNGVLSGQAGHANGSGNSASFNTPNGVAIDGSNNLYVADSGNNLIRKIVSGVVSTLAGSVGSSGPFNNPEAVAVDSSGNVYVADTGNDTIDKISPSGSVSILAGQKGDAGYEDGAGTTQALFNGPSGLAVDGSGNVYVADFNNDVVRKITSAGVVSTIAGQAGDPGYVDGPAGVSRFNAPAGVALDGSGNLYIADCLVPPTTSTAAGNDLVRRLSTAGVVSTLAGQVGTATSTDGTGTGAQFYSVQAVALNNTTGTVYLADTYNQTIRQGVLETAISLAATVPTAMVFGSVAGQITVTRTGDTSAGLSVSYSLSGTAVANTDYTALPGILTIPAGASSAVIEVDPIADSQATSSPTLQLTLNSSAAYNLESPATATVTIQEMTAYQTWATGEFGANATVAGIGGETADPNNNGVPNLLEYAFNSNPLQPGTEPLPVASMVQMGGNEYLAITYTMLNNAPDLTYTVQVTSDLSGVTDQWHSGSSYTTVVQTQPAANGMTSQVTVMDNTPISSVSHRFIRVQVSEN